MDINMENATKFILSVPIFPYLWVPHAVLMSVGLRNTLGARWHDISRDSPLSCLLIGMLYIYPGGILAALLQGEPLLSFLLAGPQLYTSLAAWYLIFYCPGDLAFQVFKTLRLQYILPILQDWQRIGLVLSGIEGANKLTGGNYLIYPIVIGILKSSGFMFVKYMEVGIINGLKTGFRVPNQATKTMIIAAVLIQLQILYGILPVTVPELYCLLVVLAVLLRIITTIFTAADWDPYAGLEKLMCSVLYGNCKPVPVTNGKKKN
jgi:hypothetical protein